jgi:hypothetical protein
MWEHSTGHRELYGLLDFFMCAHATSRTTHTHAFEHDGFSPKLMETFLGSQKLARHNWLLRARLRVHAFVRSHIFGSIRSKSGGNMHVLHAFYVRACMCTLCAHYARGYTEHMHALTHFWTDSLQTWWNILRVTESYMGYLILHARLHVHTHAWAHASFRNQVATVAYACNFLVATCIQISVATLH